MCRWFLKTIAFLPLACRTRTLFFHTTYAQYAYVCRKGTYGPTVETCDGWTWCVVVQERWAWSGQSCGYFWRSTLPLNIPALIQGNVTTLNNHRDCLPPPNQWALSTMLGWKLVKDFSKYDTRKYVFTQKIINIWNSLPVHVVTGNSSSVNSFKNNLDRFWSNQEVYYNFRCDITGTGKKSLS